MNAALLTGEQADIIVSYIEELESRVNHNAMVDALAKKGFGERQVDDALKMLGNIAGRDFGFL